MSSIVKGLAKEEPEKQPILPYIIKDLKIEIVHVAEAVSRSYQAIDNLRLTKIELVILNMVARHIVLSHAVTHSLLAVEGVTRQEVIHAFRKLMILELLNGYRWQREGDIYESPWVYTISNNGVYLLKSRSNTKKFYAVLKTDFVKEKVHILMGTLVTNAFVLYLQKLTLHKGSFIRPLLKWEEVGVQKQFMPQAIVNLLHLRTQQEFSMFVEPIRRNDNWREEIDARLTKYAFFYINESYTKCSQIKGKPVLMLIVEDNKHMTELAQHVALTPHEGFFKKNNVLITTDWEIRSIEELNLYKGVYKILFEENEVTPKYAHVKFLE